MSLPHSTAELERIFSDITNIKNNKRTNLMTESIDIFVMFKRNID